MNFQVKYLTCVSGDTIFSLLISLYIIISDVKSLDFICGSKHTLYLREDIADMEAAAKMFEQEDGILDEISKQSKSDQNMYSHPLSDMFQRAEANGYEPYCELKLDSMIEFYTTPGLSTNNPECGTQNQFVLGHCSEIPKPEVSDVSFSAASTLCSLSEPHDCSSAPKNVSVLNLNMNILFEYWQFVIAPLHEVLNSYC